MAALATASPITVGYWSIRGLGAPLRMLVMYSGAPLNAVLYDCKEKSDGGWDISDWTAVKAGLKLKDPLINLPYVIDGDLVVSQSNSCMSYLGKKLGLWGKSPQSDIECDMLLCELMDLRNKMTTFAYPPNAAERAPALLADVTAKNGIFMKLELWLDRAVTQRGQSGTFLVDNMATAPDFHLWELLDQYKGLATFFREPSPTEHFPRLEFFHSTFGYLPANAKYRSSKLAHLPYNNKMAGYGGTMDGGLWIHGSDYDWKEGITGVY
mmetsp:Transcript_26924/g.27157  ORF Transcript_26924/g.27157 Transcript_26924/m.27157 type:complete len:267 (-) Transcript_26924:200-1000(-)|eukprot:CAMPEP_0182416572 /NCGR_PEP_ID=MMETSP1167-20130531/917_1 /TAXON_ID=2988 /ORGANISM="Mallomonas Sp, Strain CCMP3275" /LENGTH=266 /DNA_ID=CAMNT_0024589471 /DNA_START=89 /DNA_END=889 /DNA_ORIENTATION=+